MSQPVPDKSPLIVAIGIVLIILSTTAIVLRFISRYLSKAGLWWDDWVVLSALPFSLGVDVEIIYAVHHGFGKHAGDGPPDATSIFFKLLYAGEICYNACIALCKLSILLFYYRIFGPVRPLRIALGAVAVLVLCWFFSLTIAAIFACHPIQASWDPAVSGHCTSLDKFFVGQAIPNVITDFILLILPVPLLWKLHVPRSQKFALIGVFLLGYFVPLISVIRLVCAVQLGPKAREDVTWNVVTLYLWSCTEPAIGIVSTCIPSISFLFKQAIKAISPSIASDHRNASKELEDRSQGQTKTGHQRYKPSGMNDFIRLEDLPSPNSTTVAKDSIQSTMNGYTATIHGQNSANTLAHNDISREEDWGSAQQIHVRKDLVLTYEQRD